MKNEKFTIQKHIREVSEHLAKYMKFSADEIAKVLSKYELDIEQDIDMDNVNHGYICVCGDVVLFGEEEVVEGIDIQRKRYMDYDECMDLIKPDFIYIDGDFIFYPTNELFQHVDEVTF